MIHLVVTIGVSGYGPVNLVCVPDVAFPRVNYISRAVGTISLSL